MATRLRQGTILKQVDKKQVFFQLSTTHNIKWVPILFISYTTICCSRVVTVASSDLPYIVVYKIQNLATVTDVGLKVDLIHQVLLVFFVSGLEYYAPQKTSVIKFFPMASLVCSICRIIISNQHQFFSEKVWCNLKTICICRKFNMNNMGIKKLEDSFVESAMAKGATVSEGV